MDKRRKILSRIITILLMVSVALPVPAFAADQTRVLTPVTGRPVLSGTINAKPSVISKSDTRIDLRAMAGQKHTGYSVVQGSCTDGKNAYYMMVSPSNQKGRLLKVRMSDSKVLGKSAVVDVNHGNGICYDSKRKQVVSCTYHNKRQRLAFFDASNLKFKGFRDVKFNHYKNAGDNSINKYDRERGLTAIAYNARYDCFVGMESAFHDIIIYDAATLEAIGKAHTKVNSKYPEVWQSMDCDDKYVYYVLSPGNGQPYNIILCLDWHSEYLQLVRKYGQPYVKTAWTCGREARNADRTGAPSAVIRTNTRYEAESLYHVRNPKTGKSRFYLTEYHSKPKYGWKTKKYKVKWKKVKKRVKWKKVKGKWRYKTKKVWKYKTKKKKVWTVVGKYRYGHVYDLGVF